MRWSPEQYAEYLRQRKDLRSAPVPIDTRPVVDPSPADAPFHCPPDDTAPITVTLAGPPQGKGRARSFLRGGHISHYTPEKTRTYEGMIRTAAMEAMGNRPPYSREKALEFVLRAVYPIPASWSLRKQQRAITGEIKPTVKPDLDNVLKAWKDSLNGVVYADDCQVVRSTQDKRYGPQPLVAVVVRPLP